MSEPAGFCDDFHQRVLFNLFNFSNNEDHDMDAPVNQSVEVANRVKQISSKPANLRPRKRPSKVWNQFKKFTKPDGEVKAICNHCEKEFVGSSKKGTSHLLHHSRICPKKRKKEGGHENRSFQNGDLTTQVITEAYATVDRELSCLDLVRSVLKRGIDLFVDDLHIVFQEEMRKLGELPSRLSFGVDVNYFPRQFLTFYYIDELWEMRSRIICFYSFKYNLKELRVSLSALNFNKSICSIVTSNKRIESIEGNGKYLAIRSLKDYLEQISECSSKGPVYNSMECILECDIFRKINNCFKYVKELLRGSDTDIIVYKIRDKFTRTNMNLQDLPSYKNEFTGFERNTLIAYAVEFNEAFLELEHMDLDFKSRNLTKKEWDVVTASYTCLKVIKDATRHLYGKGIRTTANVCIPLICDIWERLLQHEEESDDWYFGQIAACLRDNFVKDYWKENGLALAIASVLDPRFKMNLLEKWCRMIHGNSAREDIMRFHEDLRSVYNSYSNGVDNYGSSVSTSGNVHSQFPEIDLYLGEDVHIPVSDDFDILAWWRGSISHFPTLSRMARDFLAIPVWNDTSAKLTNMFDSLPIKEFWDVYTSAKFALEVNIEDHSGGVDNSTSLPRQGCPTNSSPFPNEIMMQSKVSNDEDKATCNGKVFDGSSKTRTSHLNNHLIKCPEKGEKCEDGDKPSENGSLTNTVDVARDKSAIDDELNGVEVARRIVNRGWSSFIDDMLLVYKEERQKLATYLNQQPCLFSLAYDNVYEYESKRILTVQYINEVWEVKRKTLCVGLSGDDIRILNINKSMCSLVCSDNFIFKELKDVLQDDLCLLQSSCINPFRSKFLGIGSFRAHVPQFTCAGKKIVSKAVKKIWECNGIFEKITKLFEYGWKTNHISFADYDRCRVENLRRGLYDIDRWLMITREFKESFLEFESVDSDFKLSKEEWLVITFGCDCLELLKEADYHLSRKENRIANECLPFIHDLCNKLFGKHAGDVIRECWNCDYIRDFFCEMQDYLRNRVREYWKDNGLALAMAAVLDPCFKMVLVEDFYRMIYDKNDVDIHICRLVLELRSCYNWYANGYDDPGYAITVSDDVRSQILELDCYLREPMYHPVSEDFEIIAWWRDSSSRFPTLARMARDLLAIPVWQDTSDIEDEVDHIFHMMCDIDVDIDIRNAFMCSKSLEDNLASL